MDKVFISYTRDDQVAARLIAKRLTAAGFEVFFDTEGIVAGDSWSNQVSAALQHAAAVLVLLSSNSRRSSWVQDELQTALENKKLVVPVLLDEGAKQNWLWPLVATRQSISLDLRSPALEDQLDHLVGTLSALSRDSGPAPSRAPEPAPSAAMPSFTVWRTVAIAIVSAILGALAAWLLR
jgi:TIR domain